MSTKRQPKQHEKGTGQRVVTKEKTVPAKVVVGDIPAIDFRPPGKHLSGSFLVVATNGERTRSWLIHHPIGVTDLEDGDWVKSAAADIPVLLSQRSDPDAEQLMANRAESRLTMAVQAGLLKQAKDGSRTYPNGVDRAGALADARKRVNESHQLAVSQWEQKGGKGDKPKKADLLDALGPAEAAAERTLRDHGRDPTVLAELEAMWPDEFRTRSGPNFEFDQESACPEGIILPKEDTAFDGFVYQINQMHVMGLADAKRGSPMKPVTAPKAPDAGGASTTPKKKGGGAGGKKAE